MHATSHSNDIARLRPGRNCWRIEHADRFRMLVDAEAYFSAVREAIRQARHSVYILSWDIDSRTCLVPGGAGDGLPEPLGEFLHAVLAARPSLHVYVLNWDFAMLYALEREWLPVYQPGWRSKGRLSFLMDARHPVGASHHQKVVVVDDRLAFVGGLDLTRCRWDTPEHACDHPLRCDADGVPYAPFHDVQAMLEGDAAAALAELARSRWQRAGGKPHPIAPRSTHTLWPAGIEPDLTDVPVGIARTEPAYDGATGVYEVRQLYLDAIAGARRSLFFENQYFTSNVLCHALAARLLDDDAPEVLVVSPQTQSGWLEQATMGTLRARIHQRLKTADRHQRYRMVCPHVPGLAERCLNVHSKVFAVDDDLFCIGSANMSNRSLATDTECNVVIEAAGDAAQQARIRAAIAAMRNRLLAEHLDTEPARVAEALAAHGSLHGAVAALRHGERTLTAFDPVTPPEIDALTPDVAVFDPESPIDADELVAQFVPAESRKPVPRRMIGLGAIAVALVMVALAWRFTPLRDVINLGTLIGLARGLEALPFTPLAVIAAFVLAGVLMVPVTLLIAVAGVVFGPVHGALYAIAGSALSAALGFGIGSWLGRDTVRHWLGARANRLSKRVARRGVLAMVVLRMLPVAPFTIVNVVAGASHISLRDFMLGTVLGMLPGILLTVVFSHHLAEAIRNPAPGTVAVLALVAALLIGFAFALQRLFGARGAPGVQ